MNPSGGYVNYPRPIRREIDWAVISEAWKILTGNMAVYIVGILAPLLIGGIAFGAILVPTILASSTASNSDASLSAMLFAQLLQMGLSLQRLWSGPGCPQSSLAAL